MASRTTKINPVHWPEPEKDFSTINSIIAQECTRNGLDFKQIWSEDDTITMWFFDDDAVNPPAIGVFDADTNASLNIVFPSASSGDNYWFEVPLTGYAGRDIYLQYGRVIALIFTPDYDSDTFRVLANTDPIITNCSYLIEYYGCSTDFGWEWDTDDIDTPPTYIPYIRLTDSIREAPLQIIRTTKENYSKNWFMCNAEADLLKTIRIEFSPLWWHEKLTLITLQRVVNVDGQRYIQELQAQPGEQYQNLPLFKGELTLKKATDDVLYRYGCC